MAAAAPQETPRGSVARQAAEARRAADEGRLGAAIVGYKDAYQSTGDARFLFELGELHLKLGRPSEAQRYYSACLKHDLPAPTRAVAEERLRGLELTLAVLPGPATAGAGPTVSVAPPPLNPETRPQPSPSTAEPIPPVGLEAASAPGPAARAAAAVDLGGIAVAPAVPPPPPPAAAEAPIPGWIPLIGMGLTASLLAGAIASGHLANEEHQRLQRDCGMSANGCAPGQVAELRSLARIANALWVATAVVGAGTAVTVYVDARTVGLSKAWSF